MSALKRNVLNIFFVFNKKEWLRLAMGFLP